MSAADNTPAAAATVYTPRSTKSRRPRRSRAQIAAIEDAIVEQLEREQPATVRHVFYLVANNTKLIDNAGVKRRFDQGNAGQEPRIDGHVGQKPG